jgi:hypothetical protein
VRPADDPCLRVPVVVESTTRHVLWVDVCPGEDTAAVVTRLRRDQYSLLEAIDGVVPFDHWLTVDEPDSGDAWDAAYVEDQGPAEPVVHGPTWQCPLPSCHGLQVAGSRLPRRHGVRCPTQRAAVPAGTAVAA